MTENMRRIKVIFMALTFAISATMAAGHGGRQEFSLNEGWGFKPISDTQRGAKLTPVTLPHTWNAGYADGKRYYNRETMVYERMLNVTPDLAGRRMFLYFEGVNSVATVFVNRRTAGEHKGGYTAFCIEITDMVKSGQNLIEVWAGNAFRTDVLPISGDFNVYGGIHRPVRLIVTGQDCISPLFFGSPGVFVRQKKISRERADIEVTAKLSLRNGTEGHTIRNTLHDADGNIVAMAEGRATGETVTLPMTINKPRLWNGRKDPYLYSVTTELFKGDAVVDRIVQTTGFRFFSVDRDRGFFLNGEPYGLYAFNRHEDVKGKGSALTADDYETDIKMVDEVGATMLRLAHYPHAEPIYTLADSHGIVLWSEIPLCGPGGYMYTGYLKSVEENARQALLEMVYQKYNHPSVCFWGLFNELLVNDGNKLAEYDNPVGFVRELNRLCHNTDPSRLTAIAMCVGQAEYSGCTDLMAWNKYFDWKTSETSARKFFEKAYTNSGGQPVGVSEYGRGGSVMQHADPRHHKEYRFAGTYHPEEYQAACHEGYYAAFKDCDYLWTKTIWQLFDMQSSIKSEGDTPGINDKGLVCYDRKTKKDAYYFYKANWTTAPMLHLCGKRFDSRGHSVTDIKAYTNMPAATLYVNGRKIGTVKADNINRVIWKEVELRPGCNVIEVEAGKGKKRLRDGCEWRLNASNLESQL